MGLKEQTLVIAALFLTSLLVIPAAYARGDRVPGSRYTSARGAALGDAYLPLADDGASGLFYNPAGLNRIRHTTFEPLNLGLESNTDFINNLDLNFFKATSLESYASTLADHPGSFPGIGISLFPNFSTRHFSFGVLMQSHLAATSDGTTIRYRSQYQFIPTLGTGLSLASGVVKVGYSLQWVNQAVGDITIPANTSPLGYNQGLASGAAASHNLGLSLTLPRLYLPSFHVVARNVLGAHYSSYTIVPLAKNSSGPPPDEEMTIDAGVGWTNKLGKGASFTSSFVYRDATNRSDTSLLERGALGLEFGFRDSFFIRGGYGSGYPSAGFGFRRPKAEFAFSWYSEETGDSFHSERDIRYIFQYQLRAF
jgi:hypothetical protein